jgi:hypothetical protein
LQADPEHGEARVLLERAYQHASGVSAGGAGGRP